MIRSIPVTVIMEGVVCIGYSVWGRKPAGPVLFTSVLANLVTQPLLWVVLNLYSRHYMVTLLIAEALIWMMESIFLYGLRRNRLRFEESLVLSLAMNVCSFGLGWLLPI